MSFPGYTAGRTLHHGQSTIVCTATRESDGRRVVLKYPADPYPSPAEVERYRREIDLLRRLESPHVVRALGLERFGGRVVLVTEDFGGVTLREHFAARPPTLERFLELAIEIVRALAFVHERGVVHRDVNPTNALVDPLSGAVKLIDFGISTLHPPGPEDAGRQDHIEGTFEFMAPEQTGRIHRPRDHRSDLYSLGATLHALAAGEPPFRSQDFLELVHFHIAKEPTPLHRLVPWVPEAVSRVVGKLLAKSAEHRYQSARGLSHDLEACLGRLREYGQIEPFPLGARDASPRFEVPRALHGRAGELAVLHGALDHVVTQRGPALLLVGGPSGVGKSALVDEVRAPVAARGGHFIRGKYDQYDRDIPYSALTRAFGEVVGRVLAEPPASVERRRAEILSAVGANGSVLLDIVPSLELLLGPQPPVLPLPPAQAKNRLTGTLHAFVRVLARPEHPLVLFLDDLQWADPPSLDLLVALLTGAEAGSLLVVAAYRDGEVDASHPLLRAVEEIRKSRTAVHEITLGPIGPEDVASLVAAAVRSSREEALSLAGLVHERTAGNPFFAIQFLTALHEERLITFDAETGTFRWDMAKIRARSFTDNVVDLMIGKLRRLPEATQAALKDFACLGSHAEIEVLTAALGRPEQDLHAALGEAARAGLVTGAGGAYRFLHDRVQEAAYTLIPEGDRPAVHLEIGRLLLSRTAPEQLDERLFAIVNQHNRGAALITSPEERERVAELDLAAGKRARASTAHASALKYLAAGSALLPEDAWERRHDLAFTLELHRAECEHLTGAREAAEQRLAALWRRARTVEERALVACARVALFTTLDRSDLAVEAALEYLRGVGVEWSAHPTDEEARRELEEMWSRLGGRSIEDLADLPPAEDPVCRATMDVLTAVQSPALFTDENLHCIVTYRMVRLSCEHGHSDGSCIAYIRFATLLGPRHGDYRAGFRFGKVGLDLLEKRGPLRLKGRVYLDFGALINPWTRHLRAGVDHLRRGLPAATEVGDLLYASYTRNCLITLLLALGDPLAEVQREAEGSLEVVRDAKFGLIADILTPQIQLMRALRGLLPAFGTLDGEGFDEAAFERRVEADRRLAIAACWYWIRKLQLRFLAGDHAAAVAAAEKARPLLWTSPSFFELAEYHLYAALARAAHLDEAPEEERPAHLAALAAHRERLRRWAESGPDSFRDRSALVEAEVARVEGRVEDAMRLYEEAIAAAREGGFVHGEAIAFEAAARFYRGRGLALIADTYLRAARDRYLHWGAGGKAADLQRRHGDAVLPLLPAAADGKERSSTGRSTRTLASILDLSSLMKAAQAISGEIEKQALIDQLLRITLENAGARRGWLVLDGARGLAVVASASVDSPEAVRLSPVPLESAEDPPPAIVRYVARTREPLVLRDAAREGPFRSDPRLCARGSKSVVAVPLARQGRLTGVLYLENDLVEGAFTPERVEVLALLAAQAAISLENAGLYEELEARVAERTAALAEANRRQKESLAELQGAQKQLGEASRRAGMAEIATSVLHNIGNVLNSVNVSSRIVIDLARHSRAGGLTKVAQLVSEQKDLGAFFTGDERGKRLPEYLTHLANALEAERSASLAELDSLQKHIDHIKVIVSMQQAHAKFGGVLETLSLAELVDDAIRFNAAANNRQAVLVVRDFDPLPAVEADRHKLFQILMNLLSNARHAVQDNDEGGRRITVRLKKQDDVWVAVEIEDTGEGITQENLVKVFQLGFTTKKEGHGFGLHSSSCSAIEMGGSLTAHSDGPGKGALFRLLLPLLERGRARRETAT